MTVKMLLDESANCIRKMSVSLFNAVPAGAIEVLTDANNAHHFKRADLGRFLGLARI